jgi:hypothetical protein
MASSRRDVLEARIEAERGELALVMAKLRAGARARVQEVRARLDLPAHLRERVCERPTAWLAGALVLGFWLGARR